MFLRIRSEDDVNGQEPTATEQLDFIEQMEAILLLMLRKYGPQHLPPLDELFAQAHQQVISMRPSDDGTAIIERLDHPAKIGAN